MGPSQAPKNTALKVAIVRSGKRQFVIAERAGMRELTLTKIVTGRRLATKEERRNLARVLRRPQREIFPASDADMAAAS